MKRFSHNYWVYWTSGVVWSLGSMVYFLVHNLYWLDLGFDEAFIGNVSAAFTLGSLTATLPGGCFLSRFGIKRVVWISALATGLALLGGATLVSPWLLQALAFANGMSIGAWVVGTPRFISRSTRQQERSWASSLWHGTTIGMGVLSGLLVGAYSKHLGGLDGMAVSIPMLEKRAILLASTAITAQ